MSLMDQGRLTKIMSFSDERLVLNSGQDTTFIPRSAAERAGVKLSDYATKTIRQLFERRGISVDVQYPRGVVLRKNSSGPNPDAPIPKVNTPFGSAPARDPGALTAAPAPAKPKIKPGTFIRPKEYADIKQAVQRDNNIYVYGPAGCGKTSLFQELAKDLGLNFERFGFNGELTVDNLLGTKEFSGDKTNFRKGILPTCMESPTLLLLDELDSAVPRVLFPLHPVLEHPRSLVLPDADASDSHVKVHADFRVVVAANTAGAGDMTGTYHGTNVLNGAFLDRFDLFVRMMYPPFEDDILEQYTTESYARQLMTVAHRVRAGAEEGRWGALLSTRRLITMAKWVDEWGIRKTLENCFFSKLDPEDVKLIKQSVNFRSL